jgi:hypothetical protein
MISWIASDRALLDRLAATEPATDRIALLTENVNSGEALLDGEFDTRLACDVMLRLAVSHLMLAGERDDATDARSAATWAIRSGRRALHNDFDTVHIVPRALAIVAAVLRLLDEPLRSQAVAQVEALLAGYTEAVRHLNEAHRGS